MDLYYLLSPYWHKKLRSWCLYNLTCLLVHDCLMCLLMKLEIFSSIFNAFKIYNFRILIMRYDLFILITAKQDWECYNSWVLGPDSSIFNHLHDPTSLHTYPQIVSPHIFFFLSSPAITGKGIPKEHFFNF